MQTKANPWNAILIIMALITIMAGALFISGLIQDSKKKDALMERVKSEISMLDGSCAYMAKERGFKYFSVSKSTESGYVCLMSQTKSEIPELVMPFIYAYKGNIDYKESSVFSEKYIKQEEEKIAELKK